MRQRAPWLLALVVALATAIVAGVWLVAPDTYPYGSGGSNRAGFNHLIEREAGVIVTLAAAAAGILLAATGLWRGASGAVLRVAGAGAVIEALCFAFVLGDGSVMAALGYLIAMTLPVTAVVVLVLVGRHRPRVGVALMAGVVALGVAGLVTGELGVLGDALGTYYRGLLSNPESYLPLAWPIGWLAASAGWAWAAAAAFRAARSDEGSPVGTWATPAAARRWGRVATITAALCPIPYGVLRATWVTPWPLGGGGLDEFVISRDLTLAERLQGFFFAPACAIGVILTLGLICRWGEAFPNWVPALGGRQVPVKLAVIPGTVVAAVVTLGAPLTVVQLIEDRDVPEFVYQSLGMPFWLWGPTLAFAVYAYWLRRTTDDRSSQGATAHAEIGR